MKQEKKPHKRVQRELEFSSTIRCQHVEDESGEAEERKDSPSEAEDEDDIAEEGIIESHQPSFEADTPDKDNKATGINDDAKKTPTSHMRRKLPKLAKLCDRYSLLHRAGAATATAVLEDFGLVTSSDNTNIIYKNKLHRERKRALDELPPNEDPVLGLYFDGRKDFAF